MNLVTIIGQIQASQQVKYWCFSDLGKRSSRHVEKRTFCAQKIGFMWAFGVYLR